MACFALSETTVLKVIDNVNVNEMSDVMGENGYMKCVFFFIHLWPLTIQDDPRSWLFFVNVQTVTLKRIQCTWNYSFKSMGNLYSLELLCWYTRMTMSFPLPGMRWKWFSYHCVIGNDRLDKLCGGYGKSNEFCWREAALLSTDQLMGQKTGIKQESKAKWRWWLCFSACR